MKTVLWQKSINSVCHTSLALNLEINRKQLVVTDFINGVKWYITSFYLAYPTCSQILLWYRLIFFLYSKAIFSNHRIVTCIYESIIDWSGCKLSNLFPAKQYSQSSVRQISFTLEAYSFMHVVMTKYYINPCN